MEVPGGTGSMPDLGISACHRHSQKKKKRTNEKKCSPIVSTREQRIIH